MELRSYQTKLVLEILEAFKDYHKIMLQMPTGTGKTEVFGEIIKTFIKFRSNDKRVLILVHTRELATQIKNRLDSRCAVNSALIMAGHDKNLAYQVQIATIQTLVKSNIWPSNISLIVIDEAHHATAGCYHKILEHYLPLGAKLLGVTATPLRLDGTGFKHVFDKLIVSENVKTFIKQGWLAKIKHLAANNLDLSEIPIKKGDYDLTKLGELMTSVKRIADIIESYQHYGENKKAIVFTVNRLHSKLVSEKFNQMKISSAYIDSQTPYQERKKIIEDFEKNKYKILCNVQIFTEGFDCPDIGLVILARPTKSLTLYLQMIGRVMRPSENKPYAIILDNSVLWKEHKLVTTERTWTLDGAKISKPTTIEINGNTSEAVEVISEVKGKKFVEVKEESIDLRLQKSRLLRITRGDTINVIIKQSGGRTEFQWTADHDYDVNKYAGIIGNDLNTLINKSFVKVKFLKKNRKFNVELLLNYFNISQKPNEFIYRDLSDLGRFIYDCLRLAPKQEITE